MWTWLLYNYVIHVGSRFYSALCFFFFKVSSSESLIIRCLHLDLDLCLPEGIHRVQPDKHNGKAKEGPAHVTHCITNHEVSVERSKHDHQESPCCQHRETTKEGQKERENDNSDTDYFSQSNDEHVETRIKTN